MDYVFPALITFPAAVVATGCVCFGWTLVVDPLFIIDRVYGAFLWCLAFLVVFTVVLLWGAV